MQSRLCDIVQDHSLHQLVQQGTRGSNILGLVLTNVPSLVEHVEVVENLDGCDHDAVQFDLALRTPRAYQPRRLVYNYKKANFDAFRGYMANIPWECTQMDDCIEESWQKWKDLFNAAVMECIPRVVWKRQKSKCWLKRETIKAIRKRKRLYKKAKRSGRDQDYARYKAASNCVRWLTRRDHQAHIEEIAANLQNPTNPKPFWSWLKRIRNNEDGIPQLYYGNEIHTTDAGKAEVLNRYFQSVFTREDTSNLQQIRANLPGEPCPQSFDVCALSEQEVYEELHVQA